jgi:Flp pilus assembly protein TadD
MTWKGEFDKACPLFAQVTQRQPRNGAAWADLSLCELRRGRKDEALAASWRAVRLGDEKARRHAYFNLAQLGVRLPLPSQATRGVQAAHGGTRA